jgi:hypothetical protein
MLIESVNRVERIRELSKVIFERTEKKVF